MSFRWLTMLHFLPEPLRTRARIPATAMPTSNTGRTKKDGTTDEKAHERKLKWDEENRLLASDDYRFVICYWCQSHLYS